MSPEFIAQASANGGDVQQLLTRALPWTAALVAALVLLAAGWGYYRRRGRRNDEESGPLWTLQDLREMHARGDLADDEFERLKARVLGLAGPSGQAEKGGPTGQPSSPQGGSQ
jgi:hypothetical protein